MKDRIRPLLLMLCLVLPGRLLWGQTLSGQINAYYAISSLSTTDNTVTVDDATGLSAGGRILLYQAKGAVIDETNTAAFGNISTLNSAGLYEFNTICSITGNIVTLKAPFLNSYQTTGKLQLVAIPSYGSVTVNGLVTAAAWDPATGKGGLVVIQAAGTVYLNADIDVSGQGFQGGALVNFPTPGYDCSWATTVDEYYLGLPASGNITGGKKGEGIADYISGKEYAMGKQANGGGGGNNTNTGGAGGANYGAGGAGGKRAGETYFLCHGQYPGTGGLALSSYGYATATGMNRLFLGGGGGSGHENNGVGEPGGNGGGILIISAAAIVGGGGRLLATGTVPQNPACTDPYQAQGDGGGGGGAGGCIILNSPSITGSIDVLTQGAAGSNASNGTNDCFGPGGGGGGGLIWIAGTSIPSSLNPSVSGGASGIVSNGNLLASCRGLSNGATAGNTGTTLTQYNAPESTGNTCVPLSSDDWITLSGQPATAGYKLSWTLSSTEVISFAIERSLDLKDFNNLATIPANPDRQTYTYLDSVPSPGKQYYRLNWRTADGSTHYSRIIAWTNATPNAALRQLYPNPATSDLQLDIDAPSTQKATLSLFTAQGQALSSNPLTLHTGANHLNLSVANLSAATYFLVLEIDGHRQIKSFTKK